MTVTSHKVIGFVGKRRLVGGEGTLRTTLLHFLTSLEQDFAIQQIVGISALAMGADLVFAEAVIQRASVKQTYSQLIYLPAPVAEFFLPADFRLFEAEPEEEVNERIRRALTCLYAPTVKAICFPGRSDSRNERFAETAFAIADQADLLVVACTKNDQEAALAYPPIADLARGGSAETLRYAHQAGKPLLVIQVDSKPDSSGLLPCSHLPGFA
jgi:hypothetical protein